ncbi:hypothetical protein OG562_22420 [Streptomyces sp. NBC_01275]|uniref:hypothetical protein n=1 Tax=Streptomyces sp. NBC_01275 TaxID=2903807 RepID=UPI002258E16B|nr:hypothetical protein [Streptomyces sp. NBC_01275]MCX4763667.1 hypothetical protein [Streptomyces sp. NBC_01275]
MDIATLTVVLSVVVIFAAAVLTASNEPPLWVCLLTGAGSLPLSGALVNAPVFTSSVGDSGAGEWAVRLAVASTLTAASSFFVGRDSREGAADDTTADGPPSPHQGNALSAPRPHPDTRMPSGVHGCRRAYGPPG